MLWRRIRPLEEGVTIVMRLASGFVVACAFAASGAWAAGCHGSGPRHRRQIVRESRSGLKVAGNVVTGAILNPQSGPAEIRDGKIEGNSISFHVLRTANNATTKILWQGTIEGEEIHFTRSVEGALGTGDASHRQASAIAAERCSVVKLESRRSASPPSSRSISGRRRATSLVASPDSVARGGA